MFRIPMAMLLVASVAVMEDCNGDKDQQQDIACNNDSLNPVITLTVVNNRVIVDPETACVEPGARVKWTAPANDVAPANIEFVNTIWDSIQYGFKKRNQRPLPNKECSGGDPCEITIPADAPVSTRYRYVAHVLHGNVKRHKDPELVVATLQR